MRKYVKLVSALLILVMMMAQVVYLNAATAKATTSYSAKQTDHFEKTITVKFNNAEKVTKVYVATYKADNSPVNYEVHTMSGVKSFEVTLKVKPTDEKTFRITYEEDGSKVTKDYAIGGNSYYNPGSAIAPKEDYYTGLIGGSSSSSNNGTIIEGTFDPNKWYGYCDKEDYEVKKYDYYYVTCRTLNVRNGAGTWADKVGTLKRNAKIKVYDITKSGWAVIEYDGHLRYVSARYIDEY